MSPASATRIAVLGDGGWGTTMAIHLHRLGHRVAWWGPFPAYLRALDRRRENPKFLPGIAIPRSLRIEPDLSRAVADAELILLAIPSQHVRAVARRLHAAPRRRTALIVSLAKGLEVRSLKRMSEVIHDELGPVRLAVLSGPNIAAEIARGHPANSVAASHRAADAARVQRALSGGRLRVYTATDVIGVELGGALKNPIAIAAGISDGLGFGANAKAALITRGVVEMARLGMAMGGREFTFYGLSGIGDLITTCLAGRNCWFGRQIGQGRRPAAVLAGTPMVIEGVATAKAAVALARRHGVELPIIEQVCRVLFRGTSPRRAMEALVRRPPAAERHAPRLG